MNEHAAATEFRHSFCPFRHPYHPDSQDSRHCRDRRPELQLQAPLGLNCH